MAKSVKNKKPTENIPQKSSKGLTAKQIVTRHVQNEDDIITADDMKNVKIDLSLPRDKAHKPLPISADNERPKDEEKDHNTSTPWDVIN